MEAINSDKSWDEIKELLQLKLCNANIHTHTSCFMEIQQQEKESLAAYVHWFKTEAKDATLQMMPLPSESYQGTEECPQLGYPIYKKGPQMLTDAVLEVEKLYAVQAAHSYDYSIFHSQCDVP